MAHKDQFGPEYAAYHDKVVSAILGQVGEDQRPFWDNCDYLEAFGANKDPNDEASDQIESMWG